MEVVTDRFGELEVTDDQVLSFPEGVPGFNDAHEFFLVPVPDSDGAFWWLQSIDHPHLAFLTAVPWGFFEDYEPELSETDQDALGLDDPDDALVLTVLTVHRDDRKVTANLLGPVVINQATRTGRQVVLMDQDLPVQAPLPAPEDGAGEDAPNDAGDDPAE